jgi:hypothetical protein
MPLSAAGSERVGCRLKSGELGGIISLESLNSHFSRS